MAGVSQELASFYAREHAQDEALCGRVLAEDAVTTFAVDGAHDPTASHYFILRDLFARLDLTKESRVLDVGCGTGRVLVFFAQEGILGAIDGVELDPALAERACAATKNCASANVLQGNVLDIPLGNYSHFYLFNPFDSWVLERFVTKLESETDRAVLCHMSDNGEGYLFMGRPGWRLREEGSFQEFEGITVFDYPQHWSIWEYMQPSE